MKRIALFAVSLPIILGLQTPSSPAANAGVIAAPKHCVASFIHGYGKPRFVKGVARRQARRAWKKRIANGKFGRAYAQWTLAKRREIGCARVGSKWQCTARAIPCSN